MFKKHIIFLSVFLFVFSIKAFPQIKATTSLKLNEPAPVFVIRNLENEDVFLRDYCGKLRKPWKNQKKHTIILSFFTTYCKPCLKEIPELETISQSYQDNHLKIFLINLKESKELVAKYISEKGFKLPVLLDRYGVVAKKYGVTSVPRVFIIDGDGKLIWMTKGYSENIGKQITTVLETQF
jgi:thiol-disulfide isomerase/thioredoxin